MKNALVLFLILCGFSVYSQQVTLYDEDAMPKAYIDYDNGSTIFRFDGTPVGFLVDNQNLQGVFDFKGTFVGWFSKGIVYNSRGNIIAKTAEAMDSKALLEPPKSPHQQVPAKPSVTFIQVSPIFSNRWASDTSDDVMK